MSEENVSPDRPAVVSGCSVEQPASATELAGVLMPHDAWAVPVDVLLACLHAEVREIPAADWLSSSVAAVLIARDDRVELMVEAGSDEGPREEALRAVVNAYLAPPQQGEAGEERGDKTEPDRSLMMPLVPADISALYGAGPWAPINGWRTDNEVIAALQDLMSEVGVSEGREVPPQECPFPEAVGVALAFGVDAAGENRSFVFVRADLPSALRADLWGFALAVASGAPCPDMEPDADGIVYVGSERHLVKRRGAGLLAALMLQRLGRRPGHCGFRCISPPARPLDLSQAV